MVVVEMIWREFREGGGAMGIVCGRGRTDDGRGGGMGHMLLLMG